MKFILISILVLLFVSLASAQMYEGSTDTVKIIEKPSLDKEKTYFSGKVAYVDSDKAYFSQEPYTIRKGEKASLKLNAKETKDSYTVCFDFKGKDEYVNIERFGKRQLFGLLFNDLKSTEKVNGMTCMQSFTSDSQELEFEAIYSGDGMLKYDIFIPELNLTLDPYLIGEIAVSKGVLTYFPYNNTLADYAVNKSYNETDNSLESAGETASYVIIKEIESSGELVETTVSEVYVDVGAGGGDANYAMRVRFNYTDGTTALTSATTTNVGFSAENWGNITKNNPNPNKLVDKVILEGRTGTGGDTRTFYNKHMNAYNTFTSTGVNAHYLMRDFSSVSAYLLDFGDSTDYWGSNDGVDSNVNYNKQGAVMSTSSNITIENSSSIDLTKGYYTLLGRVYVNDTASNKNIIKSQELENKFLIRFDSSEQIFFFDWTGGGTQVIATDTTQYPNQWVDFVARRNLTHISLWVNGTEVDTQSTSGTTTNADSTIEIGSNSYVGTVEYILIYNDSLTDEEIERIYKEGNYSGDVIGEPNSSISFNGVDEEIITSMTNDLNGDASISFWVNISENSHNERIIWKGDDDLEIYTNAISQGVKVKDGDGTDLTGTTDIIGNGWHHVVVVFNTTDTTMYYDGQEEATASQDMLETSTDNLYVGSKGGASNYFNGSIDELMIFNYALSESEVETLFGGFNNSINLTLKDTVTNEPITGETSVEFYFNALGYNIIKNTTDGNIFANGLPAGNVRITAQNDLYATATQFNTLNTTNGEYYYTMYMSNLTDADLGSLFVYMQDQDYYAIKGADTRLLQYFPNEAEFIEVAQCYSNSNGECVFNIKLGTERYIITAQATIDGQIITAQSSETGDYYNIDNTEIDLFLQYKPEFELPDNFGLSVTSYNTSLVGNTSYLNAYFIDINGNTHTVCIRYDYIDNYTRYEADKECTSGSSGTVNFAGGKILNRNYTYIATVYTQDAENNTIKEYDSFRYPLLEGFSEIFTEFLYPLLIAAIALLLGISIMLRNIIIFPIGMIPITLVSIGIKPDVFSPIFGSIIIVWCVGIAYLARKQSDNEAI